MPDRDGVLRMENDGVNFKAAVREVKKIQISNLIYTVRNTQVMLDSDLAELYQVTTGNLNKAMKRNPNRFPECFCFQLTANEFQNLRFQNGTSSVKNDYGGRRYMPYVFTEQGIAMLSAVLRSDVAVRVSVSIMTAFVEMRRFIADNALMFARISSVELKQLEYQKSTDEKLERVFEYIAGRRETEQKVFFDGQIYDAFSLFADIVSKADRDIILIDNYIGIDTLNIIRKKKHGVNVTIYTLPKFLLSREDIMKFNSQYPTLTIKTTTKFHDRFLILDGTFAYHVGASLKDAGKKSFAVSLLQDEAMVKSILAVL